MGITRNQYPVMTIPVDIIKGDDFKSIQVFTLSLFIVIDDRNNFQMIGRLILDDLGDHLRNLTRSIQQQSVLLFPRDVEDEVDDVVS